jgi:hypothetical protein
LVDPPEALDVVVLPLVVDVVALTLVLVLDELDLLLPHPARTAVRQTDSASTVPAIRRLRIALFLPPMVVGGSIGNGLLPNH